MNENVKKNKKNPLLSLRIKNGKNIFTIELNSTFENEILRKIKEKVNLDEKILNLIQKKIKDSLVITSNIFQKPMNIYSYKQMTKINNLIFDESKRQNYTNKNNIMKRNNSLNECKFKNEIFNKDIKPNLIDIHKNEILSSSF